MKKIFAIVVVLLLASMPVVALASTRVVTPADVSTAPGAWHPANERSGGASVITKAMPDAHGGNGSLEQSLPASGSPSPKTDFQVFSADTTLTTGAGLQAETGFGLLSDISALSFDWYRDAASTAAPHLTPSFRILVWDPAIGTEGASYLLIWEGVYNGYAAANGPVPTDQWVNENIVDGNFWRVPQYVDGTWHGISACNTGPNTCYFFDRGLDEWGFSASTVVIGLEVGLGSGWNGTYHSFADYVTLGFGDTTTVWDFEMPPSNNCVFNTVNTTMNLMADCWTTETILVPDGYTLNGNGYTITALDPAGGHFLGAVVANAGTSMNVFKLTVTADNLANVCDPSSPVDTRLRGILLNGAGGTIAHNTVTGINQGTSGCQEGNAIEVRNAPFDGTGTNPLSVEIAHNVVTDYQKTGIVANGNVEANIHHNQVGASATQSNLAANSIQIGFGASGSITQNQVDGNQWLGASDSLGTAVLVTQAGTVDISKNNIRGNSDVGIYLYLNGTVTVDNNRVFDDGKDGGQYDIGIGAWDGDEVLTNNKVRGFDTPYDGLTNLGNNKVVGKPMN